MKQASVSSIDSSSGVQLMSSALASFRSSVSKPSGASRRLERGGREPHLEAFGEPLVDRSEKVAGLITFPLIAPEPRLLIAARSSQDFACC